MTAVFSKEDKVYTFIKKISRKQGWSFKRVDTTNQMGFPDILLLKPKTYWQIEAKLLKKKTLTTLEDDLVWQFGQIAYMKRALAAGLNYMLVVARGQQIAFIKGVTDDNTERSDYPDFVRQL